MNLERIISNVCELSREAGSFIRKERQQFSFSSVEYKGHNDLVSYVDRETEKFLVKELSALVPGGGFITEENTVNNSGKEYCWIIDPLDGTTNFVHGLPCYCVSIGLMKNNLLAGGVVYEINLDECFSASKGNGAFLNNKPIRVSETTLLKQSLLATGFPYANYSRLKPYMEAFEQLMFSTHGLRRLGSAAADLAYVACGRLDGFFEYGLSSWDVAAGALIVEEAGGVVTDFAGLDNFIGAKEIIACNPKIHPEFLEVLKQKFSSHHP